jgi:hypothetical protein
MAKPWTNLHCPSYSLKSNRPPGQWNSSRTWIWQFEDNQHNEKEASASSVIQKLTNTTNQRESSLISNRTVTLKSMSAETAFVIDQSSFENRSICVNVDEKWWNPCEKWIQEVATNL